MPPAIPLPISAPDGGSSIHTVEQTPEHDAFMKELKEFHQKRGTKLQEDAKLGNISIDLYKLFTTIVSLGGYDKVSEEKLRWRQTCADMGFKDHYTASDAYNLKTVYYKNLAAYEIKTIHKREPPPPEILEHVTAKGAALLNRTVENFQAGRKEGSEDGTPSTEPPTKNTPAGSGRASGRLREAPPQRVIFQPDTGPSRAARSTSGHQSNLSHSQPGQPGFASLSQGVSSTSQPGYIVNLPGVSHQYNPPMADSLNPTVQSYQPGALQQLPLRIVDTPSSNPDLWTRRQGPVLATRLKSDNASTLMRAGLQQDTLYGPNIYDRCMNCLLSTIRAEESFATNHLLKISYERGDKFKFSQFPRLAAGLAEIVLRVGELFYKVKWTINNDPYAENLGVGDLDGNEGTPDILDRIKQLQPRPIVGSLKPGSARDEFTRISEALLTFRNMVMLPENAHFVASDYPPLIDMLCIVLNLPEVEEVVELKHCALDIAEQITCFLTLGPQDALYQSLLAFLQTNDRGMILTALRAMGRISIHCPDTNKLHGVPPKTVERIVDWLFLNDDELLDACLDFLYQYTAVVENLEVLLVASNAEHLVVQLVRLLSHGAKRTKHEHVVRPAELVNDPAPDKVVPISGHLLARLLAMEEPERCFTWLQCLFEEDADSHITQIAIWQAYNEAFVEPLKKNNRPMINAADFIKNISSVYTGAGAEIVRDGPMGEVQRFIIRGIRPRLRPISPENREYWPCRWYSSQGEQNKCSEWFLTVSEHRRHIVRDHLAISTGAAGTFGNPKGLFTCSWDQCTKYRQATEMLLYDFMAHVTIHITRESSLARPLPKTVSAAPEGTSTKKRPKARVAHPAQTISLAYEETATTRDEQNPNLPPQPAGIPLSAVLIMRNIASNMIKTTAYKASRNPSQMNLNDRLFGNVMMRLREVITENRTLAPQVSTLVQTIEESGA